MSPDDGLVDECFHWFLDGLSSTYTEQPPQSLPGVEASLANLRFAGVKVGLTTGFTREIADLILRSMGSETGAIIDAVRCGDEVPVGRPAPDLILAVMDATGVTDPADVVSVRDTQVDT